MDEEALRHEIGARRLTHPWPEGDPKAFVEECKRILRKATKLTHQRTDLTPDRQEKHDNIVVWMIWLCDDWAKNKVVDRITQSQLDVITQERSRYKAKDTSSLWNKKFEEVWETLQFPDETTLHALTLSSIWKVLLFKHKKSNELYVTNLTDWEVQMLRQADAEKREPATEQEIHASLCREIEAYANFIPEGVKPPDEEYLKSLVHDLSALDYFFSSNPKWLNLALGLDMQRQEVKALVRSALRGDGKSHS